MDLFINELEIGKIHNFAQIGQAGAVIELIVDDNLVLRVLFAQENRHMGCDES